MYVQQSPRFEFNNFLASHEDNHFNLKKKNSLQRNRRNLYPIHDALMYRNRLSYSKWYKALNEGNS